jgi:hypothetical protein
MLMSLRIAALLTCLSLLPPLAAAAEHGAPLPASLEELTCGFVSQLDEAIAEFGFAEGETPSFDDDRLNRALVRARAYTVAARAEVAAGELGDGLRLLVSAVRNLERGADVPVSGFGFAEDLAILLSGRAEFFSEDLLRLADQLGAVSAETLADAWQDYLAGVAARDAERWSTSTSLFVKAVNTLERELVLGPLPCS